MRTKDTNITVSKADKKKFEDVAQLVANLACHHINLVAPNLETPTMPYKNQYILERTIEILQERV